MNTKAKTPLGDKISGVVYNIPCYCVEHAYTDETDRMWGTREGEHKDKVRLTLQYIERGQIENAQNILQDSRTSKKNTSTNEN